MDGVRRGGALLEVFVKDTARSCLDKCAASFEEAQERQEQRNEEKAEIKARNAKQQVCMLLPYECCGSSQDSFFSHRVHSFKELFAHSCKLSNA